MVAKSVSRYRKAAGEKYLEERGLLCHSIPKF